MATCPASSYALANNTCAGCIPNCASCSDSISCDTCNVNYLLLENTKTCILGPTCPIGYYLNAITSSCKLCKSECSACTGASVCTSCIIGFSLSGSTCSKICGNGLR